MGAAGQAEHYLQRNLYRYSCISDPTATKILPNILSMPGGKHKQAHDLCGFDASGSVHSLKEPMYMRFGGTDVENCFCTALKGMSRSGAFNGSAGPAAFKEHCACPD